MSSPGELPPRPPELDTIPASYSQGYTRADAVDCQVSRQNCLQWSILQNSKTAIAREDTFAP